MKAFSDICDFDDYSYFGIKNYNPICERNMLYIFVGTCVEFAVVTLLLKHYVLI